jgi:hypothetical protein
LGYKIEEKLYLGVREQKKLNTKSLNDIFAERCSYFHNQNNDVQIIDLSSCAYICFSEFYLISLNRTIFENLIHTQPNSPSLWNQTVHYFVARNPPLNPVLSRMNSFTEQVDVVTVLGRCLVWVLGEILVFLTGFFVVVLSSIKFQDRTLAWPLPCRSFPTHLSSIVPTSNMWVYTDVAVAQLLRNFPTFYGTRRFIIMFTRALHYSLSWARSIQSIPPHPVSHKIHLNIVLPPISRSSQWSLSFWCSCQNAICIPLFLHVCKITHQKNQSSAPHHISLTSIAKDCENRVLEKRKLGEMNKMWKWWREGAYPAVNFVLHEGILVCDSFKLCHFLFLLP